MLFKTKQNKKTIKCQERHALQVAHEPAHPVLALVSEINIQFQALNQWVHLHKLEEVPNIVCHL